MLLSGLTEGKRIGAAAVCRGNGLGSGAFRRACILLFVAMLVAMTATDAEAQRKKRGGGKSGARRSTSQVVHADVYRWILANNPGLPADFLRTEPPDRQIKLPDGTTVPIYRLKQFLDVNFRLTFFARRQEGADLVRQQEMRLRKLLALPAFRDRIMTHRDQYIINGRNMSNTQAYNRIRNVNRRLGVTASSRVKAPVGGGGGINAPSWAVWKQMNLFWHEACHCIGIHHNSGGISGPIAGTLRQWDRQERWNYPTIDLNALKLPE